ncbi:HD domain-containing protein, partial [Vibrio parahaemolyticus]
LHDTVEDTVATLADIEKLFGPTIAKLVDGVTKISQMTFRNTHEKQSENIRKMIIAMGRDIRVILVKLADRLHNMRTLNHMPLDRQIAIAQ